MASIAKENSSKYISEGNDSDIQPENASAAVHIRKPISTQNKGGKTPSAHFINSEPTAYTEENENNVQYAKAAELKKNLEREVALGQMNDKKSIKNSSESFSDSKKEKKDTIKGEAENKQKHNKYFAYEKTKNENKYRKRVYRIEKKYKMLYSQTPNAKPGFTLFRKLSILNQSIIAPIKKGNPIGIVTAPATVFIKRKLEKYKLGRIATRTQEAGKRIVSAVENTADTSQGMAAVTDKAAKEAVKGTAGTVYRYIDRKRQKKLQENKYLKEAAKEEIAQYVTNIRYIKTRDAIAEREKAFNEGKASEKLAKKVENFNKKDNTQKKQQKIEKKNQKLEKKIQRNHRPYNSTLKKKIRKTSTAKLLGLLASGGIASIVPIVLIVLIIAIVASYVFYPFFYLSVTEETTDDEGNVIKTEDKIEDSEIPLTVAHYHGIMNGVVDKINAEIDAIFAGGYEYNNTGAIFEGFRWSPESTGHKVPYGELYDEMLCTIAAYNSKLMNQAGNTDIIFMNDETVEAAYVGANFWELSNWEESVECKSGGNCCSEEVAVLVYDEKGKVVGKRYVTQYYCPGHFVIMVELKYDFNLDEVWESYGFDDEDKKTYKEILKQLKKDK